ncbi:MAG: signal recognition particle protein [Alphaproteobacteria bacterium]|nr:signal recognition particle protein [Alphaproteobacteria bacterium]
MFDNLSQRLGGIFDKLRGRGALSEQDVSLAMREIRVALLEADVALSVVKEFIEQVKEKAIGQDILKSVSPGQQVVKIVHDHLIEVLGHASQELNLSAVPPVFIMMVGLQGSGKTTSTAKLAKYVMGKERKKILMASLDIYRPAAREQLAVLGREIGIETLHIIENENPLAIAKRAADKARLEGFDLVFLDTAGRLHVDELLMQELQQVRDFVKPIETLLVADSLTGQDAVHVAKEFNEKVGLTGIVLTRVDGDARGGAALSMRSVTGCPIKFLGMGEQVDKIEVFHPDRIAGRILDMGDVLSLVERAVETIDQQDAEKMAAKMQKGLFDLNDMATQMLQMQKMGGMSGIMGMMPGVGKLKDKIAEAGLDDTLVSRQVAIIRSMTKQERKNVKLLNASRRRRIACGSGTTVADVNRVIKQYLQMADMMKKVGKLGKKGFLRNGIKGLFN